jgi:hypothetical protein
MDVLMINEVIMMVCALSKDMKFASIGGLREAV